MRPNALWHACKAAVCTRRGHPLPFITGSLVSLCCMFSAGFTPNAAQVSPSSRLSLHNCHAFLFFLFFAHCFYYLLHNGKYKYILTRTITACRLAVVSLRQLKVTRRKRRQRCCETEHKKERRERQRTQAGASEPCVKRKPAGGSREGRGVRRGNREAGGEGGFTQQGGRPHVGLLLRPPHLIEMSKPQTLPRKENDLF